ncbi:hypothetical protein BHE74_00047819 [Ensete ventricosum]|nr:hypothetical protein GW17_00037671 [Ensete ventricosum]RWW46264.1 hypothetical protein BHE74_00047819 [Ensete ventricosum]
MLFYIFQGCPVQYPHVKHERISKSEACRVCVVPRSLSFAFEIPAGSPAFFVAMAAASTVAPGVRQPPGRTMDDENLVFETSPGVEAITSFDQMGIRDDLLRGIYAYGFEKPSAIQQRAVIPIISGRDVIAQAQSGTGKSSMIALSVCQMVDTTMREYDCFLISF